MFTMLWSEKCSNMCYGLSSGSIIGLFSFMTTVWLQNDDSQFHIAYACVEVLMKLVILFAMQKVLDSSQQTHHSYHELLELTVLFLCDIPPYIIIFMAPRAMHRGWGNTKLLYCVCVNIWVF